MSSVAPKKPEVANSTKVLPDQFCPTIVGPAVVFIKILDGVVKIVLGIGVELVVVCSEGTSNASSGLTNTARIWYWFVFIRIITLTLIKIGLFAERGAYPVALKNAVSWSGKPG